MAISTYKLAKLPILLKKKKKIFFCENLLVKLIFVNKGVFIHNCLILFYFCKKSDKEYNIKSLFSAMNNKHTATSRQFFQTLTICICLLFAGTYSAKASDRDHRQYDYVLILNSYNESAPWSNSITSPIMHKISELKDIDAYIEHLNLFMVNDSVMVDRFPQMLLNKYGKTPPKLLVLLGSMSMIFREEIKEM